MFLNPYIHPHFLMANNQWLEYFALKQDGLIPPSIADRREYDLERVRFLVEVVNINSLEASGASSVLGLGYSTALLTNAEGFFEQNKK